MPKRRKRPSRDDAAGRDDLLVNPLGVATQHHEASVRDHRRRVQLGVVDDARGDTVEADTRARIPHVRPQEAEAALHERVIEVREDDVRAPIDQRLIEHDRPDPPGMRIFQTFEQRGPRAGQRLAPARRDSAARFGSGQSPGTSASRRGG